MNASLFKIKVMCALSICLLYTSCIMSGTSGEATISIETGTSFGECRGYCKSTLKIEDNAVKYSQESWQPAERPAKMTNFTLTAEEVDAIQLVLQATDISALEEVIGCPDCADGGAEWLKITRAGKTQKITFEYGAAIKEIDALMALLRPLRNRGEALLEAATNGQKIALSEKQASELVLHEYRITGAMLTGNYLLLTVDYDGGCREHDFKLYMAPDVFMESSPVQAALIMRHDNNGDNCDAVISREIAFDLTPMVERYKSLYNGQTAPIILNIAEFSAGNVRVVRQQTFTPVN